MKNSGSQIASLLRRVDPPADTRLEQDLWPRMKQRVDRQPQFELNWFDRVVLLAASLGLLLFPRVAAQVLYYL